MVKLLIIHVQILNIKLIFSCALHTTPTSAIVMRYQKCVAPRQLQSHRLISFVSYCTAFQM